MRDISRQEAGKANAYIANACYVKKKVKEHYLVKRA